MRGSEPLAPPPPRATALLARLLTVPRRQTRERLVELLFPDTSRQGGRRRLSDRLWLIRQALPGLPLHATDEWLQIPADERWLDVDAFREWAASPAPTDWPKALDLYGGDLLPSCYEDWILLERESLHLAFVDLLFRAGDRLFQLGQADAALPIARRLAQEEPLDERALRLLMRTNAALGRRGTALAAYERFIDQAADEVGIAPAEATQALANSIRTFTPVPLPIQTATGERDGETLLARAQDALHRGESAVVEACIQKLTNQAACAPLDVALLRADLALLREAYDDAEQALQGWAETSAVLSRRAAIALARRDRTAASTAASLALLAAHEEQDEDTSVEALLVLAQAQRRMGHVAEALATSERALNLATSRRSSVGAVRSLLEQGDTLFRHGRMRDAIPIYDRARSVAHEHGFRRYLAEALQGLVNARSELGVYLDVLPDLREALSIWRDLGLRRAEARTLQTLASICDLLGRHQESMRNIERARELYEDLNDGFGVARCRYHLAANIPYRDETLLDEAVLLADQAIATFRQYDEPGWEASALTVKGQLLVLSERYEQALDALGGACAKHEALGEVGYLPEPLAHQGLAHLALGNRDAALACTRRAVLTLAQGILDSDMATGVYYAHAQVLDAHGLERQANDYLVRGYERLVRFAEQLEDESARRAFFTRGPMVRRLMDEVYERGIAPRPDPGVVTRWLPEEMKQSTSLEHRRLVPVALTLDAGPADTALRRSQGGIALRRARLTRILHEAEGQGVRPTIPQLADALNVSERTIKRDLAALREDGRIS